VVDGRLPYDLKIGDVDARGYVIHGAMQDGKIYYFLSNTHRDVWIAAVHKHLAEWAYGDVPKMIIPEAAREADVTFEKIIGETGSVLAENYYKAWREKWMKPREPKKIGDFLYEV
jgi:hypothetical protein